MTIRPEETTETRLARIEERLVNMDRHLTELTKDLTSRYVTRDEFAPVRQVVYGMVAVLLLAVAGAIVRIVVVAP